MSVKDARLCIVARRRSQALWKSVGGRLYPQMTMSSALESSRDAIVHTLRIIGIDDICLLSVGGTISLPVGS